MPDMIWTGTFGKLKVLSTSFLSKEFLLNLTRLKDVKEVAQALESTWYAPYIEEAGAKYSLPDQVEVALNRHLVNLNSLALNSAPPYDKNAVRSYLAKWDVYNIELVLAAKSVGRSIGETEAFLVSSRNIPVGFAGGLISFSELRSLLELPDVDSVVESLVKYGYGAVLLQRLPDYQKSRDLGVLSGAQRVGAGRNNQEEPSQHLQGDGGGCGEGDPSKALRLPRPYPNTDDTRA